MKFRHLRYLKFTHKQQKIAKVEPRRRSYNEEDVKRGQLEKGSSECGLPAFPAKENASYKAIQSGRRMVVDNRALHKVTVRRFFFIPNSDYIKSTLAGHECISVGDLKKGSTRLAMRTKLGGRLPLSPPEDVGYRHGCHSAGPTNGPEEFQESVFTVFQWRSYKDLFCSSTI